MRNAHCVVLIGRRIPYQRIRDECAEGSCYGSRRRLGNNISRGGFDLASELVPRLTYVCVSDLSAVRSRSLPNAFSR